MPINIQDILKINIVLGGVRLLPEPHQHDAFIASIDTDVVARQPVMALPAGFPGGFQEADELTFALPKDRIELSCQPSQSVAEREYPATIDDLDRLAEITSQAIALTEPTGQTPVAYGFNIQMVYLTSAEEPSGEYLAKRLFRQLDLGKWSLTGGSGHLSFRASSDALYNFTVEPRFKDPVSQKVFLSLNLHKDRPEMPDQDELVISLRDIWVRCQQFATQLDGSR